MESIKHEKSKYFKNIDFFRFVFIISIVVTHFKAISKSFDIPFFQHISNLNFSHVSVDLFFVISGFFLFYTMNKFKGGGGFLLLC